ncbi:MAG: radical SAM protein [Candidatus Omnitrophota bacterium]
MKVAFIQNLTEQLQGYMFLSSSLKTHGHVSEIFVDNFEKNIVDGLKRFSPDVLGFYCVTGNLNWGLSLMREYKKYNPRCLTLLGGPHPTFFPEVVFEQGIDAISMGESENAIVELCEKYNGTVESIYDLNNICILKNRVLHKNPLSPLIANLDSLPTPDRSIYDKYRYFTNLETMSVMASRGCPFNCNYCYSHKLKDMYKDLGKFVRFRSPLNIIAELKELIKRYRRLRYIIFADSTLNTNNQWLLDFLTVYKNNINLPFTCYLRVDITTSEQIDALADANCRTITFGIEAGSYRLRKEILKRDMKDEVIINIAKKIKERKIILATGNMFGLPTETLDETLGLIHLNQRIKADIVSSTIFTPYPGTELERIAKEKGLLGEIDYNNLQSYYHHSVLKQKDIRMQERIQKIAVYFVWYPKLSFFWKFLVIRSPFCILHLMFLLSLAATVKKAFGYSFLGVIRYGALNFNIFSKN